MVLERSDESDGEGFSLIRWQPCDVPERISEDGFFSVSIQSTNNRILKVGANAVDRAHAAITERLMEDDCAPHSAQAKHESAKIAPNEKPRQTTQARYNTIESSFRAI